MKYDRISNSDLVQLTNSLVGDMNDDDELAQICKRVKSGALHIKRNLVTDRFELCEHNDVDRFI